MHSILPLSVLTKHNFLKTNPGIRVHIESVYLCKLYLQIYRVYILQCLIKVFAIFVYCAVDSVFFFFFCSSE